MATRRIFEVERKFARLLHYPLTKHSGQPSFYKLDHLGKIRFHDKYFDFENKLSAAGVWVRQRDGKWQAKLRQAGDYNNSQFQETENVEQIREHVASVTGTSKDLTSFFGLSCFAAFTTNREIWKADSRFNIVSDATDFSHTVGEVELEISVPVTSEDKAEIVCERMDAEIVRFMRRYDWAFDTVTPAIGKLTAYIQKKSVRNSNTMT